MKDDLKISKGGGGGATLARVLDFLSEVLNQSFQTVFGFNIL
jgi:hypothetical protein